jgi:hypothetical protein
VQQTLVLDVLLFAMVINDMVDAANPSVSAESHTDGCLLLLVVTCHTVEMI